MKFVNTATFKVEDLGDSIPDRYAILSHRWYPDEEVTYQNASLAQEMYLRGWDKIEASCRRAAFIGLRYLWADTCCIDKTSSAELSEAINSMYAYYQDATECYAYLADVTSDPRNLAEVKDQIRLDSWFTRGWTLQELLAPRNVRFYNSSWQFLGTKADLCDLIQSITDIHVDILQGKTQLESYSIAQRMSWAAHRETSRPEDQAYCLLGIFNVRLPVIYGEKHKAFRRLQEEIIRDVDDPTILAWHDESLAKSILATSPSCFAGLHNLEHIDVTNDLRTGYTLSNSGLKIDLMLFPYTLGVYTAPLGCGLVHKSGSSSPDNSPKRGYDRVGIFLRQTEYPGVLVRVSMDGDDTVILNSDRVAQQRDSLKITSRQVLLRQRLCEMPARRYSGFICEFGDTFKPHEDAGMRTTNERTATGTFALPLDLSSAFAAVELHLGQLHSAALTSSNNFHMYLGFDLDFAPICLITTQVPKDRRCYKSTNTQVASGILNVPVNTSWAQRVRLSWLFDQLSLGVASHTPLCFRGSSFAVTSEINCEVLSLKIVIERKQNSAGIHAWVVRFASLDEKALVEEVKHAGTVPDADTEIESATTIPLHGRVNRTRRPVSPVDLSSRPVPNRSGSFPFRPQNEHRRVRSVPVNQSTPLERRRHLSPRMQLHDFTVSVVQETIRITEVTPGAEATTSNGVRPSRNVVVTEIRKAVTLESPNLLQRRQPSQYNDILLTGQRHSPGGRLS